MLPEKIKDASLLDILFENRNKDYGAYVLRKDYDVRVGKSLAIVFLIAACLCLAFLLIKPTGEMVFNPSGTTLTSILTSPPPVNKAVIATQVKKHSSVEHPPVIVQNIQPPVITDPPPPGDAGTSTPGDVVNSGGIGDPGPAPVQAVTPAAVAPAKPDVPEVLSTADVMPQFAGGTAAFIKYLQRNLKSPRDLEDNEQQVVRVQFIVNLDGSLRAFKVLTSAGEEFDNEVLRVLQKMPKWIAGKSRGENVSVYYTLPVKFTPME
jgi:periplasmic protein TonB